LGKTAQIRHFLQETKQYVILLIFDSTVHHLLAEDRVIRAKDKTDAKCVTKLREYQRGDLKADVLKTENLDRCSDIPNMKIEDNIQIKGTALPKY
jgi:hypothetical protein